MASSSLSSSRRVAAELREGDSEIAALELIPYRSKVERAVERFLPAADQPQALEIRTPWGGALRAKAGDYIVSEVGNSERRWPVQREIFERTYERQPSGLYRKRAIRELYPLAVLTKDPGAMVRIHTREGEVEVRAGDFHLAKGVDGEIWAFPSREMSTDLEEVPRDAAQASPEDRAPDLRVPDRSRR